MEQILEFEKPLYKAREELEDARRKGGSAPSARSVALIAELEKRVAKLQAETYTNLTPWQRVQIEVYVVL